MPKKYHELIDETEDLVVKEFMNQSELSGAKEKLFQLVTQHIQSHRILLRGCTGAIDASFLAKSIKEGKELILALKQRDSLLKK